MPGVMLAQVRWDDVTDPSADTAITTHHYEIPVTPSGPNDYTSFVIEFTNWFTNVDAYISTDILISEIRFYEMSTATPGEPGPAVFVQPLALAGSSLEKRCPPQVAMSVSERTAVRARWGRFYIPGLVTTVCAFDGRFDNAIVTEVATHTESLYEAMRDTGREFCSYRRSDGTYQLVKAIVVDNVPDVIRRRRFSTTTFRDIRDVTPP